jgi:alkylhydroperoxidase family enzyme
MKAMLLATAVVAAGGSFAAEQPPPRLPPLSNEEAWKLLPRENPPLPAWARVLAGSLPRTTALQLELDYTHRAKNPLDPALRGKLRWVAADANRSPYARRYAEADLRKAGLGDADLKQLAGDWSTLSGAERAALTFARDLTRAAYAVTDDQVADLVKHYGPDKVVAMVHTVAHANFQDRILLALGVEVEEGGPLPPLDVRFDARAKPEVPARPDLKDVDAGKVKAVKPDWLEHSYADLQKALDGQKGRKSRIPLPALDALDKLPPDVKQRTSRIVWSRVSMGYQPGLTRAWFDCMGAFQQEAKLDQVFTNTLFWVITRSNECFY